MERQAVIADAVRTPAGRGRPDAAMTQVLGRRSVAAGLGLGAFVRRARAQAAPIRVAVLNDQSSAYSGTGGAGTVAAVRLAAEDMQFKAGRLAVEVLVYDHQNKTDIGAALAARAYDQEGVDAIFDIGNSAVSLAVQDVARQRGKIVVHCGSAHEALYGKNCSPTGAVWVYDTYSLAHGLTQSIVDQGGRTWFFITADYAFGTAMQSEATAVLTGLGGKVLGSVRHPVGTSDFSAYIVQAQASGADIIALANASSDTVNAAKQAAEFGVTRGRQRLATLIFYLNSVHELGAQAEGLQYLESWYWDVDDETRALAKRFAAVRSGTVPNQTQAGNYSAVLHYLRAVAATDSRDGQTVMRQMKSVPVNDAYARNTVLRADGRLMKDYYLVQVKPPGEVRTGWDLLRIEKTLPAASVIRPMSQGGCSSLDPV